MSTDDLSNSPRWRELSTAAEIADALIGVFEQRGDAGYDEVVSQNAHALQCGDLAIENGADDALVIAAFLHDIGHLLLAEYEGELPDEDRHHENVGARFLANWFDDDVTQPIRLHVSAKRHLCATEASYWDHLSQGSKRSLELQGGPFSATEVAEFEASDRWEAAVALRRWDDLGKAVDADTNDLGHYRARIAHHLS